MKSPLFYDLQMIRLMLDAAEAIIIAAIVFYIIAGVNAFMTWLKEILGEAEETA